MHTFSHRLRQALAHAGLSQAELARRAGLSQPTVNAMCQSPPKRGTAYLLPMARALGVRPQWLATGDPPMTPPVAAHLAQPYTLEEGATAPDRPPFQRIPPMDGEHTPPGPHPSEGVMLGADELARLGIRQGQLAWLRVRGSAMEPRIREGDLVVVDQSQRTIGDEEVYAVAWWGTVRIRRLFRERDGGIRLEADHPDRERHPTEAIPPEALGEQIRVVGRVVWVGGRV